ncbi:MAG: type II toxin-antitoxin system VapC family toxin [Desulfobacterales bacterium]|nr:type II toxin-antitoxin system VapC family toxin [Desulfobacterales bacterium]
MDKGYVLDSYALMAHFEQEPGAERVERLLKAARAGKTALYLTAVNLGEIYYSVVRERGIGKADETLTIIEELPISIVAADKTLAVLAGKIKAAHPIAYADCFAAALANQLNTKVVTGDPEFKKLENEVGIEWLN